MTTVNCKLHGEFELEKGCPECIRRMIEKLEEPAGLDDREMVLPPPELGIVKVRYFSETTGMESGREYTYFTEAPLKVGDIVIVPIRDTHGKAKVSAIDVPASEIAAYRDKVKTILAGSKMIAQTLGGFISIDKALCASEEGCEYANGAYCKNGPLDCLFREKYGLNDREMVPNPPAAKTATNIKPLQDAEIFNNPEIERLLNESARLQQYAEDFKVEDLAGVKLATNDLAIIAQAKKTVSAHQDLYLEPVKEQTKTIKDAFSYILEPLRIADMTLRGKVYHYREGVKRQEEAEAEALALRRKAAEIEAAAQGKTAPTLPAPTVAKQPDTYRTDVGTLGTAKIPKWEVEDINQIPMAYMMPDATKIGKTVRAGGSIPGIKVWYEESLRVTAKKGE